MRTIAIGVLTSLTAAGCLIDDRGGTRGQPPQPPTASVPDSGSPVRRESAAETLREADPPPRGVPEDQMLDVPPPPVR